jgi:hypothetical protein
MPLGPGSGSGSGPGSEGAFRPLDRSIEYFLDPTRRIGGLVGFAYVAAVLGLSIVLFTGSYAADDGLTTVGVLLMFAAFLALFYLSITVIGTGGSDPRQ